MSHLADLWSTVTGQAQTLDVPRLRATIVDTMDDGLRAANYEGAGGRSADVSSHPERQALNDRRDPTVADLALTDHHTDRFVSAVYELATRSHSGPFPNDWTTARIGARRLADMDAITILVHTGQKPARWVHQAGDALHDLELLAGRHMTRVPDDFDRLLSGDTVCLSHARIGDYVRPRHGDLVICKTCRDLIAQVARPPEVHKDSEWWPTIDLLREHAEMERTGRRADYQRARTDWIAAYPPRRHAG